MKAGRPPQTPQCMADPARARLADLRADSRGPTRAGGARNRLCCVQLLGGCLNVECWWLFECLAAWRLFEAQQPDLLRSQEELTAERAARAEAARRLERAELRFAQLQTAYDVQAREEKRAHGQTEGRDGAAAGDGNSVEV